MGSEDQHGAAACSTFHLTTEPSHEDHDPSTTHDRRHAGAEPVASAQASYVLQVSQFARYFNKSPAVLGPEEIRSYQVYLTNQKKLEASSIKVAVAALRFLYRVTLKRPWDFGEIVPSPKAPRTLPIILSPDEVVQFLSWTPDLGPLAKV